MAITAQFKGYVTLYASIAGKNAGELEKSLGFNQGSLAAGYLMYELTEPIAKGDFEWRDRTRYSAGWKYDPSINEYVQRRDQLRAHFGKIYNWDEAASDLRLQKFMDEQFERLKTRRIVKIVPKGRVSEFPDSLCRDIPQWELRVRKTFTLITT